MPIPKVVPSFRSENMAPPGCTTVKQSESSQIIARFRVDLDGEEESSRQEEMRPCTMTALPLLFDGMENDRS